MNAFAFLLTALLATSPVPLPALTDSQRSLLALANDGGNHQEEAFLALLEHVRKWTPGEAAAVLQWLETSQPPVDDLLNKPADHRGEFFIVGGVLQQQSPLGPGFDGVSEWFVRDSAGRPLQVFVIDAANEVRPWRDGQRVEVPAMFYKITQAVARDGSVQRYAAFVGKFPQPPREPGNTFGGGSPWLLAIPLGGLFIVFVALSKWVRRTRLGPRRTSRVSHEVTAPNVAALDDSAHLPDDPAAALTELKRRADDFA